MSIDRFFTRAGTIIHPALVDSGYGGAVEPHYDSGTQVAVMGWLHQLSESEQQSATRDAEVSTHVYRVPPETTIDAVDQVVIDGQTFNVDGPPSKNWRPGGLHHLRVPLSLIDG